MLRRIAAIAVVLVMFPALGVAGEPQEIKLTLEDAVALALRENRDVLLQAADVEQARSLLDEARGLRRPQMTVGGSWELTSGYYPKDIASLAAQASVTQTLFTGGAVVSSIRQAETGITIEEAALEGARLDTVLLVQKGFFTLLLARRLADLNKGILENSLQHLAIAREKYRKGEVPQSEVLDAQARSRAAEYAYSASVTQADSSKAALNAVLSLDPSVQIVPEGVFAYDARVIAYDEAFAKAIAARPQIREQEARIEAQRHAVEVARSGSRPQVSASWDYYSTSRNAAGLTTAKGWNDHHVLGLAVSWPVFDGWQTRSRVEQETVKLRQASLNRDKVRQDIALEVAQAHLAVAAAASSIRASEADILLYRENLQVAGERFRQGQISRVAFGDAELKYRISAFNRDQAVFEYLIAKSALQKATGGTS